MACSQFFTRPGFGQNGKRIVLNTNHFSVDFNHKSFIAIISQSSVCCKPSNSRPQEMTDEDFANYRISCAVKAYGKLFFYMKPVYDGSKNMFSCGPYYWRFSKRKTDAYCLRSHRQQLIGVSVRS